MCDVKRLCTQARGRGRVAKSSRRPTKKRVFGRSSRRRKPARRVAGVLCGQGGRQRRFVVDYSKLNKLLQPCALPLPLMDHLLDKLAACKFKSKMDLTSGFWQVRLSPESKNLTSFILPNQMVYRFKVLSVKVAFCTFSGLGSKPGSDKPRFSLSIFAQSCSMLPLASFSVSFSTPLPSRSFWHSFSKNTHGDGWSAVVNENVAGFNESHNMEAEFVCVFVSVWEVWRLRLDDAIQTHKVIFLPNT